VQIQTVTQDIADSLGLKKAQGALVAEPQAGGPSAEAGIVSGDVIQSVNGKEVKDARDLVLVAPIGTPESIIQKASTDLRSVVTDPDLQKKIAARGSYTRAMSPAEVISFVVGEQRKSKPVMELIAQKTQ
jgi:hypothetical protein